jgi:7 transmembrane helices usually fused to an inactive transglutaminase
LPMISLTMMIEAFQKRTEENGYRSAFKKLGITLMVAFCCWLLFSIDEIQWTFLTFPESEFFVAAALVLVGSRKEANATSSISSAQVSESAIIETPHSIR